MTGFQNSAEKMEMKQREISRPITSRISLKGIGSFSFSTDGVMMGWSVSPISLVIFLAVGLRVALAVAAFSVTPDLTVFHQIDTQPYLNLANSLLATGTFSLDGLPETVRTPGYPVFLMTGIALGHVEVVTIILQVLISCFTVFIAYESALLVFERKSIALLAATLCALDPASVNSSVYLMSETLFQFCVAASVFLFLRLLKKNRGLDLILTAVFVSAAIYVRPQAYVLLFLFLAVLAYRSPRTRIFRAGYGTVTFFLFSAALLAPWHLRNGLQTCFWGFSSVSSHHYFLALLSESRHKKWSEDMSYGDLYDEGRRMLLGHRRHDQLEWDNRLHKATWELVRNNPWSVSKQQAKGTLVAFMDSGILSCYLRLFRVEPRKGGWPPESLNDSQLRRLLFRMTNWNFFKAPGYVLWPHLIATTALFVLNVCGLASIPLGGPYRRGDIMLLFLVIMLLIVPTGLAGYARYRVPVAPLLNMCAAAGMFAVYDRLRMRFVTRRTEKSPILPGAC